MGLAWAGLFAGLSAAPAAQAQFSAMTVPKLDEEWRYEAGAIFERQWEARLDRGDKFDYTTGGLSGIATGPMGPNLVLGGALSYTFTEYGFLLKLRNNIAPYANNDLPKDPWGGVNTVESSLLGSYVIDERFSVVASVPITFAAEVGADQNAVTAGIGVGLRYQLEDRLSLVLGVGVMSEIEDSERIFPIIGLDYRMTDSVWLRTQGKFTEGGRFALVWGASTQVEIEASIGYDRRRFRLDRHGGPPGATAPRTDTDGVGEFRAIPVMLGIKLDMVEGVVATLEGGVAFGGQLRVEDSDGRELYERTYEPAPRLNLNITVPF